MSSLLLLPPSPLQHATYEVQALVFTYATTPITAPMGYRLRFRGYTTFATLAGTTSTSTTVDTLPALILLFCPS